MADHRNCKYHAGCDYRNDVGECPDRCIQYKHKDDVRVVRCKDCKKYRTDSCAMSYTDRNEDMPHCWARTNDFCSYGERKE